MKVYSSISVNKQPSKHRTVINYTHQIGEVVTSLAAHESRGVSVARDVADIGLQQWRVGLEDNKDERRQEVVSIAGATLGCTQRLEYVTAAAHDALKLVLWRKLAIHLNNVYNKTEEKSA